MKTKTKTKKSTRRMGVQSSEVRAQLIEAAEQIVKEEGCAALTARLLAEKVGLKRQIVHYYFGTIEDLLIAVLRREGERTRARLIRELDTTDLLRWIWELGHGATSTSLEFVALGTRRKAVQAEVKGYIEEFRRLLSQAVARYFERRGLKPAIPPATLTIVLMSISQSLAVESALGVSEGHSETKALVEEWLRVLVQGGRPASRGARRAQ